jgi:pimeloyl-ACP methyl ester carboxylesterase
MSSAPAVSSSPPKPPVSGFVRSFDETRIAYDLYDHTSRTLVLVVPGFWRFRRHPSMMTFAAFLNAQGYRAAVVDPRGHGDSGGVYGFNLHEHFDVAAVAAELLAKLPIDAITLVGLSYGGAIAIATAARQKLPIASLILVSPVADHSMIAPRINPLTFHRHIAWSQAFHPPKFDWRMRRSTKFRALDDVRELRAPIEMIHVKNDWLVSHRHSQALYDAANEPKELHVIDIPGNYHADRIFSVAGAQIEPLLIDFLEKYSPR